MIDATSIIALISAIVAIGGGLFGLFQGLHEYRNSQIKKKRIRRTTKRINT